MSVTIVTALVGAACTIVGMVAGLVTRTRQAASQSGLRDGSVQAELTYIAKGVDEIRLEQKAMRAEAGALAERITRVEESAKQAHRRIDYLQGKEADRKEE